MDFFVAYFIIYVIEGLILWQYSINIFPSKFSSAISSIGSIIIFLIPFLSVFQNNMWLNVLTFTCASFIYIMAFHKAKWYTAFFHATINTIVMSLSELLVVGLISNFAYDFYEKTYLFSNFAIFAVLSKLTYFFLMQLIVHFNVQQRQKEQVYNFSVLIMTLVPIISVVIDLCFTSITIYTELSTLHDRLIGLSAFLLLILNIIIFGIYNYNQKKSLEHAELQLQYQKEYDSAQYYKMLSEQHENQGILIHDIKKHLNSIATLNEQGDSEKVASYITQIIASPVLQENVRICDNQMLNIILSRYHRSCEELGVKFHPDVRSNSVSFLQDEDLTALFCNLLDNSVEAASKQADAYIELHVSRKENTPFTIISVINSCRVNPFSPVDGSLISRKPNPMRHGYGVKSIQNIVKKYNGDMQMYYDEETLTFHTIILLKNEG